MQKEQVLIMGASPKADRYSFLAANMLLDYGHEIYLFGNHKGEIRGHEIQNNFPVSQEIDTVTMYLNERNQQPFMQLILDLKPRRVIFNPGAENDDFSERLKENGIEPIEACTLVMLRTGQW